MSGDGEGRRWLSARELLSPFGILMILYVAYLAIVEAVKRWLLGAGWHWHRVTRLPHPTRSAIRSCTR